MKNRTEHPQKDGERNYQVSFNILIGGPDGQEGLFVDIDKESLVVTPVVVEDEEKRYHLISVRHLHEDPVKVRKWLSRGHHIVLTRRNKLICYISAYVDENNGASSPSGDSESFEDMMFMTVEDIRSRMDYFAFNIEDGQDILIGHYKTILGVATREIPEEILDALEEDIKEMEERMSKGARKAWETKRIRKTG